jgi:predicted nucleotidyltransferase
MPPFHGYSSEILGRNLPGEACLTPPSPGVWQRNPVGLTSPTSLSDALFSGVQQRVLRLLFGQADREFHGNEIMKLAQSGKGALQRELRRLTESGLVLVAQVGNQKRYRANPDSPVFAELTAIVRKTFGLSGELRDALQPIAGRISVAFVYGSVAKGTDTAASDIDLLVVSDSLSYQDLLAALAETEARLNRKVNPTLFSTTELERRRAESSDFVVRVLQQPKLFVIGGPHELGEPGQPVEDRQAEGRGPGAKGV